MSQKFRPSNKIKGNEVNHWKQKVSFNGQEFIGWEQYCKWQLSAQLF